MKKSIKSILVLVCICATVSVLLALVNSITAPIIEANESQKANGALLEVLPDGGSFELMDISTYTLPATVAEVYQAKNGGYVIKLTTTGYNTGMVLMCGINPNGTIAGTKLISSAETPAIGGVAAESFAGAVVGKDITTIDGVDTISGATKTTTAYRAAIKDALNAAIILGGGSVDLRTEEEIFNDALSAVLPAAGGKFTKYFFVEVVEGIDAIYTADNKKGAVCIIGEKMIGIDEAGQVLTDCTDAEKQSVQIAMETINATTTTDIDLTQYADLSKQLISAKQTATGNYIIEIKALGYSSQNSYAPESARVPIAIRVSLTAEGVVIDTLTLSHAESTNIGDICANESYYGQFDGKNETEVGAMDTVAGATKTTAAYKKAILEAFNTVKILEEGNQS